MLAWNHLFRDWTTRKQSRELVDEAGAFLTGSLALDRARHGSRPQDWEWVNFLAHSSAVQLARLSANPYSFARLIGDEEWWSALIYLAERILYVCRSTGASLEDVQRTVLVPLELELSATSATRGCTAAEMVDRVVSRLGVVRREYRRGGRRDGRDIRRDVRHQDG